MIRRQIARWREVLQAVRPVLQEGFPPQATGSPVGVSRRRELRGIAYKTLCNRHLRYYQAILTQGVEQLDNFYP
ncbi:MAG: hypothetical protein KME57_26545 [Scytonema hyalinum WJT4-NPBG1]|jgi:hypothetical protein|nr:hypothetical protein [Scytonema hyalinum WJT4-NPBG1]